jgi:hypothetical protein
MAVDLKSVIDLALQLSPRERIQLVERMAASVENILPADKTSDAPTEHWGQALGRLLDELEPVEFVNPEIEDAVEWVKHQRATRRQRRLDDWGTEE